MLERLTKSEVERIAALARLALTDAEQELYTRQLGEILEYAEQVQELDTSAVPPTTHVLSRHPADRSDVEGACLPRTTVLENAPEADATAGLFRVPRVIGG